MNRIVAVTTAVVCAATLSAPALAAEAAKPPQGKALFTKYKCNACHSIESAEIKRVLPPSKSAAHKPPDLSKVGDTRSHEWIEKFIVKEETIDGRKHPILFKGTKEERTVVAAWLETLKSPKGEGKGATGAAKPAGEEAKPAGEAVKPAGEEAAKDTTHAH